MPDLIITQANPEEIFPLFFLRNACPKNSSGLNTAFEFWSSLANLIPGAPLAELIPAAILRPEGDTSVWTSSYTLDHIRQASSILRDGDMLLHGPLAPLDELLAVAESIHEHATFLLHPQTPVESGIAVAGALGKNARLCIHPKMPAGHVADIVAALNTEATLLVHPATPADMFNAMIIASYTRNTPLFDQCTPCEKLFLRAVSRLKKNSSWCVSPCFTTETVKTIARAMPASTTLVFAEGSSPELITAAASVLHRGAILVLPADIPPYSIINVIAAMGQDSALLLPGNISRDHAIIVAACIPSGLKLVLHPHLPENIRQDIIKTARPGTNIVSMFTENNLHPPVSEPAICSDQPEPVAMVISDMAIEDAPPNPADTAISLSDKGRIDEWAASNGFEYIHTEHSEQRFLSVEKSLFINKVAVLAHTNHSFGVFTNKPIKSNTILGKYQGEVTTLDETKNPAYFYRFDLRSKKIIDAEKKRNWTAMLQPASSPATANIVATLKNDQVIYEALVDILPHQQLLIWFGDDFEFNLQEYRYLKATDTWLDSRAMLETFKDGYKQENQNLNKDFISLFDIPAETYFKIPKLSSCETKHKNLPLLALNARTLLPAPQSTQENITLLMLFCWNGAQVRAAELLKNGANANIQTSISGISALHVVVASRQKLDRKMTLISYLRNHGALLNLQDKNNQSILHWAIKYHDFQLINHLLEIDKENCLLELIDNNQDDFFLFALKYGTPQIANLLQAGISSSDITSYLEEQKLFTAVVQLISNYPANENQDDNVLKILLNIIENLPKTSAKRKRSDLEDSQLSMSVKDRINHALDTIRTTQQDYQPGETSSPNIRQGFFADSDTINPVENTTSVFHPA